MQCEACGDVCTADLCRDCSIEVFEKWQSEFKARPRQVEPVLVEEPDINF
jgi:hypothetical protein